jgi:PP-loop superfamily ATP-utilizing enzyme
MLAKRAAAPASAASAQSRPRRARCVRVQAAAGTKKVNKVVLAYSGGLDTSIILKWLVDAYGCEVVTFTADLVGVF